MSRPFGPNRNFLQAEDGIRDLTVTGVQTCALPISPGYRAKRDTVVKILNEALATEIVCVLRYRRHHFMASGIHAQSVAGEFLIHSNEEQAHADLLAQRIVQLGCEPNFSPDGLLSRSHAEYVEGATLLEMI